MTQEHKGIMPRRRIHVFDGSRLVGMGCLKPYTAVYQHMLFFLDIMARCCEGYLRVTAFHQEGMVSKAESIPALFKYGYEVACLNSEYVFETATC